MKRLVLCAIIALISTIGNTQGKVFSKRASYKCLIQLTNYGGEGAYVITSLLNPEGNYEKTLFVGGDDEEWYPDLPGWFRFFNTKKHSIDGITGASIQSGGRKVALIEVDTDKLNTGYKLRFESAVEDGKYYKQDLEVTLSDEIIGQTFEGTGYIRYVRIINNEVSQ